MPESGNRRRSSVVKLQARGSQGRQAAIKEVCAHRDAGRCTTADQKFSGLWTQLSSKDVRDLGA